MRLLMASLLIVLAALASPTALALDYRSVSEPAILFDAPGGKGGKLYIIARGTPVEVVLTSQSPGRPKIDLAPMGGGSGTRSGVPEPGAQTIQDNWTKVRGGDGSMAWIESRLLSTARTLLVRADKAEVRAEPNDNSPLVFTADRNVLLDLLDAGFSYAYPGWVKVKHRDGESGYVKASQVWGL